MSMKKRGKSILLMLFEFIIVISIIYIVTDFAFNASESEAVKKTNAVQDIALAMDTLIASPAETEVRFPKDMSAYSVAFQGSTVTVYNESEPEWRAVRRHFIAYADLELREEIARKDYIYLFKSGPDIGASAEPVVGGLTYKSVAVETLDADWKENKKIVLVPVDSFTEIMAEYINSEARPFAPAEAKNLPLYEEPDIILNIRLIKDTSTFSYVNTFYPRDPEKAAANRKLAVLINNKLVEKIPDIKKTWLESAELDAFPIFNEAEIVIILSMADELKEKSSETYAAVYEALEEYYE